MSETRKIALTINGKRYEDEEVEVRFTLADFMRQQLGLTGTHLGCEHGVCGACTILFDGRSARSCLMLAVQADGHEILTVEGIAPSATELHPLQEAFRDNHGLQCGFCTPGMLTTLIEFLRDNPDPTEKEVRIAISGNLCRCTGYQGIVDAALDAAQRLQRREGSHRHIESSGLCSSSRRPVLPSSPLMAMRFDDIGHRLKAFRLGSGLCAEEIAQRLGISRTALYRFEKGEVVKIDTLEKLAELLDVSLPTLLGVGVEYIPSAVTYFERMRQIEETAEHIVVLAGPVSYLLASDAFNATLAELLKESIPEGAGPQRALEPRSTRSSPCSRAARKPIAAASPASSI